MRHAHNDIAYTEIGRTFQQRIQADNDRFSALDAKALHAHVPPRGGLLFHRGFREANEPRSS